MGSLEMDSLEIEGGIPLNGDIYVSGAKNAALPLEESEAESHQASIESRE